MSSLARAMVGLGLLAFGCHGFALSLPSSLQQQQQQQQQHQAFASHHRHPSSSSAAGRRHGFSRSFVGIMDGGGPSSPPSWLSSSTPPHMSLASTASTAASNLGAASAAALLRGGSVEHNVISGVLAELANIRTPAALLGGAALGTMFVQLKPGGNKRLHLLYTLLSTSAFSLQLVCVLCSTLTYTSVASREEALALSAIGYLSQQMQWEFFVIRGSFMYGLFSFLGALAVRGWLTYSAKEEQWQARAMMSILASSAIFLLNFLHYTHNSLTLCLGGMTKAIISMTLRNMYPTKKRLFRHAFAATAVWVAVKLLKLGPNEGPAFGKDKDGGDAAAKAAAPPSKVA